MLEEVGRLLDRHVEDLRDIPALVSDVESVRIETAPVADIAGDVDIGKEVHFDLDGPVALAVFAAAALHVEGEPARLPTPRLGLRQGGKEIADPGEYPDIGRRVRTRRAADGTLVYIDDLVDGLESLDRAVIAFLPGRAHDTVRNDGIEQIREQGRLARSGDARDAGKQSQLELDVDALEIVLAAALDDYALSVPFASYGGYFDAQFSREILSRDALAVFHDFGRRSLRHHVAAVHAGARPQVDDPVGRAQRLFVVLHDDESVADVAQEYERVDEALVVALVQADGRLVEDVEHSHERGTDLSGETYALGLASRQGSCLALESQVLEADVAHEVEPRSDLLEYLLGDLPLGIAQRYALEKGQRLLHRLRRQIVHVGSVDRDRQGFRPEAPPPQPSQLFSLMKRSSHCLMPSLCVSR